MVQLQSFKSPLLLISFSSLVVIQAATVEFRVVAPNTVDNVQVSVNGQVTPLSAKDPDVPYFVGQAEASDNAKYKVSKPSFFVSFFSSWYANYSNFFLLLTYSY